MSSSTCTASCDGQMDSNLSNSDNINTNSLLVQENDFSTSKNISNLQITSSKHRLEENSSADGLLDDSNALLRASETVDPSSDISTASPVDSLRSSSYSSLQLDLNPSKKLKLENSKAENSLVSELNPSQNVEQGENNYDNQFLTDDYVTSEQNLVYDSTNLSSTDYFSSVNTSSLSSSSINPPPFNEDSSNAQQISFGEPALLTQNLSEISVSDSNFISQVPASEFALKTDSSDPTSEETNQFNNKDFTSEHSSNIELTNNDSSLKFSADPISSETSFQTYQSFFNENQASFNENQASFNENLASFNENLASFNENQASFNENQASSNENQASFNENQASFNENQANFNENQANSNENQASFNENQASFNENQASFNENQASFNEALSATSENVSTFSNYNIRQATDGSNNISVQISSSSSTTPEMSSSAAPPLLVDSNNNTGVVSKDMVSSFTMDTNLNLASSFYGNSMIVSPSSQQTSVQQAAALQAAGIPLAANYILPMQLQTGYSELTASAAALSFPTVGIPFSYLPTQQQFITDSSTQTAAAADIMQQSGTVSAFPITYNTDYTQDETQKIQLDDQNHPQHIDLNNVYPTYYNTTEYFTNQLKQTNDKTLTQEMFEQTYQPTARRPGFRFFVGGLLPDLHEQEIVDYFSTFGEVREVRITKDYNTGQSRGFGFVTVAEESVKKTIFQQGHHEIRGKRVDVREENHSMPSDANRKIFVGGLDPNWTEAYLSTYFAQFGNVEVSHIVTDATGKSRCFAFVTFSEEKAAQKVLEHGIHNMMERSIEVRKAEPKRQKTVYKPPTTSFPSWTPTSSSGQWFGGNYNNSPSALYGYDTSNWNNIQSYYNNGVHTSSVHSPSSSLYMNNGGSTALYNAGNSNVISNSNNLMLNNNNSGLLESGQNGGNNWYMPSYTAQPSNGQQPYYYFPIQPSSSQLYAQNTNLNNNNNNNNLINNNNNNFNSYNNNNNNVLNNTSPHILQNMLIPPPTLANPPNLLFTQTQNTQNIHQNTSK